MIVRCEWGAGGLSAYADATVLIIVDVLSFTTTVDVATSRGATVFPFEHGTDRAATFAREMDATLAGARGEGGLSLSPVSFARVPRGSRVVLPSLNGATLSRRAGADTVIAGCLRNRSAVARAVPADATVTVVPSGERWPDGTYRPALEDLLGAGAIIDALGTATTPEARAAVESFLSAQTFIEDALADSVSGIELTDAGYLEDVHIAADVDASASVPILSYGAYSSEHTAGEREPT